LPLPNNVIIPNIAKENGTVAFIGKGNCAVVITAATDRLRVAAIGNGELIMVPGRAFNLNVQQSYLKLYFTIKSKV